MWNKPGANLASSWEIAWNFSREATGYMFGQVTGFYVEQDRRKLAQIRNYLVDILVRQSATIQRFKLTSRQFP